MNARGYKFIVNPMAGTILVLGGMLAVAGVIVWWQPPKETLADWYVQQLPGVHEEDAEEHLWEAARLGPPGMQVLAQALVSDREPVAGAARSVIRKLLASWEREKTLEQRERLDALIAGLAARHASYSSESQEAAAFVAERALLWPPRNDAQQQRRFLLACHQLIPATASRNDANQNSTNPNGANQYKHPSVQVANEIRRGGFLPGNVGESRVQGSIAPSRIPLDPWQLPSNGARVEEPSQTPMLPGGGLAVQPAQVPALPPTIIAARGDPVNAAMQEPPPLFLDPEVPSPVVTEPPSRLMPPLATRIPQFPERTATRPDAPATTGEEPNRSATEESVQQMSGLSVEGVEIALASDRQVMELLHHQDARLVDAAYRELARRGFSRLEWKLAQAAAHPQAEVRQQLVESLPTLQGISLHRWFRIVMDDPHPQVRQTVVSMVAASNSPQLKEWLAKHRLRETNGAVRTQIEETLER